MEMESSFLQNPLHLSVLYVLSIQLSFVIRVTSTFVLPDDLTGKF